MAEIKIEKKPPIWPWILLGLIILVLLYFLLFRTDDDVADTMDDDIEMTTPVESETVDDEAMMLSETADSKIRAYQTYIDDESNMGLEHKYSHSALTKLIDATQAVANTLNVDINADLGEARSKADHITKDTYDVDHADKIKAAGNSIVKALKTIQSQKFPDLNDSINELQEALNALAPGTKTLEQKTAMKNFYEQAEELLINMKKN
ncbi:hypothetical protein [Winogradskyella forsetii]|uniref:hypothetical protein n=1 Tax=Winogradskyella forsetii TaxID=2686077 RepID=UPI0015BCF532|nr:hypothetical protein [Winogradskyella forsetii]